MDEELYYDERDFEREHFYTLTDEEDDLDFKQRPELDFDSIPVIPA